MTAMRDKSTKENSQHFCESDECDVTPLCSKDNVVSHPTCFDTEARLVSFRRSIAGLSYSDLKKQYPAEFNSFRAMKDRAREGVCSIHAEMSSLAGFLSVVGPQPGPKMTVDRINNEDKAYAPGNVRWANKRTQANNRSNTVMLTDSSGLTLSLSDWARRTGQKPATLRQRRARGWTDVEIIEGKDRESPVKQPDRRSHWYGDSDFQHACESAYKRLRRHYKEHPGLTRNVVLAWLCKNRAAMHFTYLEENYPDEFGDNANPNGELSDALLNDRRYSAWKKCCEISQSPQDPLHSTALEREMYQTLCRRPDRPVNPWNM